MKRFDYQKNIKKLGGFFLSLIGLLILLSPGTHLYPLAYPFVCLFGMIGHILICSFIIFLGIYFLLLSPLFKIRYYHYIGLVFSLLFLSSLFSVIFNKQYISSSSLEPFFDSLLAEKGALKVPFDFSSGGGLIGYFFDGIMFRSTGLWLIILVLSLLGLLSIFFLFLDKFISLFKLMKARRVLSKAKKSNQEEIEQFNIDGYEANKVERVVEDKKEEPIIAPEEEDNSFFEDKPVENPLTSFVFEPAGDVPLPSRKKASNSPLPSFSDLGPSEINNPSPNLYANNSVSTSGLREAVFSTPISNEEIVIEKEEAKPIISEIKEEKLETHPSISKPSFVKEEKVEVKEETPIEETKEESNVVSNPLLGNIVNEEAKPNQNMSVFENKNDVNDNSSTQQVENDSRKDNLNLETTIITSSSFSKPMEEARLAENKPMEETKPEPAQIATPNNQNSATVEQNALFKKAKPLPRYTFPGTDLLVVHDDAQNKAQMEEECSHNSELINDIFSNLKIGAHVVSYVIGPSVTRYDVKCDDNFSVSGLGKCMVDIGVKLGGVPTRFAEMVAGKDTSAIEIANKNTRIVDFKEVIDGMPTGKGKNLYIPFGVNIEGKVVSADLSKFPHMLVAGTTGSGKSIYMHSVIMTLIMRNRPEDLKIVMVDPKRVELSKYKDLPHLLCPIIKTASEAKICLKKLCDEMERRYEMLENATVSGIREYNEEYAEPNGLEKMPFIVAFLDEYSDLVDSEKDISSYVLKLAAKARAAGIHLFIATQRPDAKIITGTIKANLPVRVALMTANAIDSTVILGQGGAEELAGHGDMLVDCSLVAKKEFVRCQCPMVENKEISAVANFVRDQQSVVYDETFLDLTDTESPTNENNGEGGISAEEIKNASQEEKYQLIKNDIMTKDYASISFIQRTYGVGFPRAGKIFARLQAEGIVASSSDTPSSSKGCQVLVHSSDKKDNESENPGSLSQSETTFNL